MKTKYIITVLIIFVAVLAFNIFNQNQNGGADNISEIRNGTFVVGEETMRRVTLEDLGGLQFEFRVDPDKYDLLERGLLDTDEDSLQKSFNLILSKDYEELKEGTTPREGPPSTTIDIFKNTDGTSLYEWAEAYENYSNIGMSERDADVVSVAGENALYYRADGLYASQNIVFMKGGYVYLISGKYIAEGDMYQKDFNKFAESLRFAE